MKIFSFSIDIYKDMIYSNHDPEEAIEIISEMEYELPKRDNILLEAIKNFSTYNFFQKNEIISVHYLDDSSDGHGFIRMPWVISIGHNYALVELRHGTWY